MSKTTTVNAIPYPEDADAPDGPVQIKALAELLDTLKWGSRNLKPTTGIVEATETLGLTGAYQDVKGTTLEITPAVASILKVTAVFEFRAGEAEARYEGTMRLDAADQTPTARLNVANVAPSSANIPQVYSLALTAALHTIKMRAKRSSGASGGAVGGEGNTRYLYELVAS